MNLKELEQKINEKIAEKDLKESYQKNWQVVDSVKAIVDDILDDYRTDTTPRVYVTTYKNNIEIHNTENTSEIIIKVKKHNDGQRYNDFFSTYYLWAVDRVVVIDDEFKTLDDYLKSVVEYKENKNRTEKEQLDGFKKALQDHNITYEEFSGLMVKYQKLSYSNKNILFEEWRSEK